MNQLDLFCSGTKPETSQNEVKKDNEAAKKKTKEVNIAEAETKEEAILTSPVSAEPNEEVTVEVKEEAEVQRSNDAFVFLDEPEQESTIEEVPNIVQIAEEVLTAEHENPIEEKTTVATVPTVRRSADGRILQKRGRKSFAEINAQVDLINIPDDETLFKKQYYSISEVAGWFNVNTSLLRFWETEFDVLKPRKNRKGDRMFRPEDVKNLQLIYHLLRDRKYTIDGAKDYIKGNKKKADTQLQLTQSLQKFKSFLLELKANLQ